MKDKGNSHFIRICGIDPGTNVMGYSILDQRGQEMKLVDLGTLYMKKLDSQEEKLQHILTGTRDLMQEYKPSECAVEAPFYGKNVQSMLKLGRAQGVAIAAAMVENVSVREYSPKKIKLAITGNGNAAKEQVKGMLEQLLNCSLDEYPLDATDALAAAVCHGYQRNTVNLSGDKFKGWGDYLKRNPGRKK